MSNVPRPHILYVEDNASMRTLMAIRLAQAGCEGALSEDFSSAKQIIESGRPIHGVISDGVYRGEGSGH